MFLSPLVSQIAPPVSSAAKPRPHPHPAPVKAPEPAKPAALVDLLSLDTPAPAPAPAPVPATATSAGLLNSLAQPLPAASHPAKTGSVNEVMCCNLRQLDVMGQYCQLLLEICVLHDRGVAGPIMIVEVLCSASIVLLLTSVYLYNYFLTVPVISV